MSTVEEIEAAIRRLSPDEMAAFRDWYAKFDAAAWDRQIAEDAESIAGSDRGCNPAVSQSEGAAVDRQRL